MELKGKSNLIIVTCRKKSLCQSSLHCSATTGKRKKKKQAPLPRCQKERWARCAQIPRLVSGTTLRQQRGSVHLWSGGVGTPKSNCPLFRHLQLRLLYCLDGSRFSKQPTLESKENKDYTPLQAPKFSIEESSGKKIPFFLSYFRTSWLSSRGKGRDCDTIFVMSTLFLTSQRALYMRFTNGHYTRKKPT